MRGNEDSLLFGVPDSVQRGGEGSVAASMRSWLLQGVSLSIVLCISRYQPLLPPLPPRVVRGELRSGAEEELRRPRANPVVLRAVLGVRLRFHR